MISLIDLHKVNIIIKLNKLMIKFYNVTNDNRFYGLKRIYLYELIVNRYLS